MEEIMKENEKTGKLSTKHRAVIGIAAALVVIAGALIFFLGSSSVKELQKQLDLGQKYLEEINYEEAVVAFKAAIEIDPMSVDAYLGLVEVYIRTGDFDTALEYAKKGYEMTGDERLKEKIDIIESGNITASNGWTMRESYYDADGALLGYLVYQHGEQGRIEWVSSYNADGSLINEINVQYNEKGEKIVGYGMHNDGLTGKRSPFKIEYEYDTAGNAIVTRYYDVDDGTLGTYEETEYDTAGNVIASRVYDADDTLQGYSKYEYDTAGNVIADRHYDADGTLYLYNECEYDTAGYVIVAREYEDDTLLYYIEYEYDTAGNVIADRAYHADGTLYHYTEYEYDTAGNRIAERDYDGDGNLESETRYD